MRSALAVVLVLTACASRAAADERDFRRRFDADVTGERSLPAAFPDARGTLVVTRVNGSFDGRVALNASTLLQPRAVAEATWYRFSDVDRVVPGTGPLIDHARLARIAPMVERRFYGGWGLGAGPILQTAGASGADVSETLTWGMEAYARIPLRSRAGLRIGASFETRLDDSIEWWPVLAIEGAEPGRLSVEGRGSGLRVGYAFTPTLSLGLDGRYDRRDFRLAPDSRVPDGVWRDRRWAVGADVSWKPRPCVEVYGTVWRNLFHDVSVGDRDGRTLLEASMRPSWQFGLTVSLQF